MPFGDGSGMIIGGRASEGNITTSKQTGASEIAWPWLYAISRMVLRMAWVGVLVVQMHWFGKALGLGVLFLVSLVLRPKLYVPPASWSGGRVKRALGNAYRVVHRGAHWLFCREPHVPKGLTWLFSNPDRLWQNTLALAALGVLLTGAAMLNWWPAWEWRLWTPALEVELGSSLPALDFDREPQFGDVLRFRQIPARMVTVFGNLVVYSRPARQAVDWFTGADHLLRMLLVLGLPFVVIGPSLLLDWVFAIESKSTNFRSVVFGKVDASGVRLPDGERYKSLAGGGDWDYMQAAPPVQGSGQAAHGTRDYS